MLDAGAGDTSLYSDTVDTAIHGDTVYRMYHAPSGPLRHTLCRIMVVGAVRTVGLATSEAAAGELGTREEAYSISAAAGDDGVSSRGCREMMRAVP